MWKGKWWEVDHPTLDAKILAPQYGVLVLGDWDGPSPYNGMTWQQVTNFIAGNVLRQNLIAARLRRLGFLRFEDEPYVAEHFEIDKYILTLSGDEIEALLDLAESNLREG